MTEERRDKNMALTLYHDDFFPLEQIFKDSFWTGYYTSRPNLKKEVREFSQYEHFVTSMYAMDRFRETTPAIWQQDQEKTESLSS